MVAVRAVRGELSSAVRLVNLTEHEIVLDAVGQSGQVTDPEGLTSSATVRVPPAHQFAQVDDAGASLGEGWLNVVTDRVRLTTLSRSGRVIDLPAPEPGTTYVVSRLTAHAACRRADLVFPLTEIRDADGRIIGARGLGSYRRARTLTGWYRDWRTGACERRSRRSLPAQWPTGVLFVTATALLSGALGLLPGVLDGISAKGWAAHGQVLTDWLTVIFLVSGAAVLWLAAHRWLNFMRMRGERGTAYVIEEQAIHWLHEEKAAVLAKIAEEFASVLRVPGAEALGAQWQWQCDAQNAPRWDARTDELVHSFWAVHYNDDQVTRNAVFVWAPWPVAMAFGARATARRRGLVLHVRQRPSSGAAGTRGELRLEEGAHVFLRGRELLPLSAAAPRHTLVQPGGTVTVMIQPIPGPRAMRHPANGTVRGEKLQRAPSSEGSVRHGAPAVLLLLVRFVPENIGPIPLDLSHAGEISLYVPASASTAVLPNGNQDVPVAEWRLTADDGSQVPWPAFPAVAEALADWVQQQAAVHPDHTILLAARMPQEIAVGLGIQLGQRSASWPSRVYPVYYTGECLVVPGLDLGRASVPAERK